MFLKTTDTLSLYVTYVSYQYILYVTFRLHVYQLTVFWGGGDGSGAGKRDTAVEVS